MLPRQARAPWYRTLSIALSNYRFSATFTNERRLVICPTLTHSLGRSRPRDFIKYAIEGKLVWLLGGPLRCPQLPESCEWEGGRVSRTYYFMNDMPPSIVSIRFWRIAPTQSTMLMSLLRVTWNGAVSAAYRSY